ncbi:MAG: type II toxin-antitoxin system HicA family toxin [Rhodospirillales bacterium]|nr:type II toxin-antitoxin system HicA family toxin [Rhodospirillales bacterium]MBR9816323.1 type II toxin-antitoxin system HicA family toxin [Rhodospirillales bacterium]
MGINDKNRETIACLSAVDITFIFGRVLGLLKSKEIIRALLSAEFEHVRTEGSHWHFKKNGNPNLITVVHPRKDNPIRYVRKLEKLSGVPLL